MTAARFSAETARRGRTARVSVRGALDMASVPSLQEVLDGQIDAGIARLVVDLGDLDFMDSTGISLALRLSRRGRQTGFEVAFIPGPPRVQRIFELSQIASLLTFCDAAQDSAG
jgi:anti-sigma B factor antagonist